MKILVICYSYSPNIDPRALRWTALCEEWAKLGNEVHVISGHPPGQRQEEKRKGVHLYRAGGGWISSVRQWALKQDAVTNADDAVVAAQGNDKQKRSGYLLSGLRTALKVIYDLTWKRFYWPDSNCLWILPAVRYGRRLVRKVQFDAIVSVSHPFSGHIVGLLVGRTASSETVWLADSGDPFALSKESAPNNFRLYNKLNHWVEGKVLSGVKRFSVTTTATADIYQNQFPAEAHKVIVIPPMLQDNLLEVHKPEVSPFDPDAIVLLFVGVFYRDIRSPLPLLELLSRVIENSQLLKQKIQLHIVGSSELITAEIQQYPQLCNRLVLHGKLPHAEAVRMMRAASCLVNISNITHYQLPSKVIEYMATGKPILNLCSIENDASASVLRDYPSHLDWMVNKVADVETVCQFLVTSPFRSLGDEEAHCHVQKFTKLVISQVYLSYLQDLQKADG